MDKLTVQDEILADVKTGIGMSDTDELATEKLASLSLYIKLASKSVALYCAEQFDQLPSELSGVVTEMALAKFGKRGNEGKTQSSEEGISDTWNVDELAPYMTQLNSYMDNKEVVNGASARKGLARSYD